MATFDEALKNAVAEATKEVNTGSEVKPEPEAAKLTEPVKVDTPADKETPVKDSPAAKEKIEAKPEKLETKPAEPAKAETKEPEKSDEEDDLFRLSAEELSAIDTDPKLKKAYKSMLRDYRKKTGEVAERKRTLGDRERILEAMAEDPDMAVRALAAIRGIKIVEPETTAKPTKSELDLAFDKLQSDLGPEAAGVLRPVFEAVMKSAVEKAIADRVAPLEKMALEATEMQRQSLVNSGLAQFKAELSERGEEWDDEIEESITGLVDKMIPGEKTTFAEHMQNLYDAAISKRLRAQTARDKIARLKDAATKQEPTRASRPAAETERHITSDMPQEEAVRLAVEMAQAQIARGR